MRQKTWTKSTYAESEKSWKCSQRNRKQSSFKQLKSQTNGRNVFLGGFGIHYNSFAVTLISFWTFGNFCHGFQSLIGSPYLHVLLPERNRIIRFISECKNCWRLYSQQLVPFPSSRHAAGFEPKSILLTVQCLSQLSYRDRLCVLSLILFESCILSIYSLDLIMPGILFESTTPEFDVCVVCHKTCVQTWAWTETSTSPFDVL